MSSNWPYAKMTHEASLYGGPDKYIASIRKQSSCEGRLWNNVTILLLSIIALGCFNMYSSYKLNRTKRNGKLMSESIKHKLVEMDGKGGEVNV